MTRQQKHGTGCRCICHESWGGSAHPKQRCRCRSGPGFEDLATATERRAAKGLPPLRVGEPRPLPPDKPLPPRAGSSDSDGETRWSGL